MRDEREDAGSGRRGDAARKDEFMRSISFSFAASPRLRVSVSFTFSSLIPSTVLRRGGERDPFHRPFFPNLFPSAFPNRPLPPPTLLLPARGGPFPPLSP